MYILNVCENPDILGVIYFILKLIDTLLIAIPIGLIVFITIDVFKMIVSDDKGVKDAQKMVINRLIFAVAIFFIPTIVTLIMNLLTIAGINVEYKSCITNATKENIESFRDMKDIESGNNNGNNNGGNGNSGSGNIENNEDEKADKNVISEKLADQMIKNASTLNGKKYYKDEITNNIINTTGIPSNQLNLDKWCADFVTWVANKTESNGYNLFRNIIQKEINIKNPHSATNSIYVFANSTNLSFHYSKAYGGDNYIPKKGDYIYFKWVGTWDKKISANMHLDNAHVGIVSSFDGTYIHTIEGNVKNISGCTDNQRCISTQKKYKIDNEKIIGFGSWYN